MRPRLLLPCQFAVASMIPLMLSCISITGENTPPPTPSLRAPYSFHAFSTSPIEIVARDPEGDDISYKISVTDDQTHKRTSFAWSQYFPGDEPVVFLLTPENEGSYTIDVYVRDSMNAVSAPGALTISVAKPFAGTWYSGFSAVGFHLNGVSFGTSSLAWAVGGTTVLTTATSGSSWVYQWSTPNTILQDVDFVSSSHGWLVGTGGVIAATTNGGTNWNLQDSGTTADLLAVQFTNESTGWACGNGVVLATVDGGATWNPVTPFAGMWQTVSFVDANRGWAGSLNGHIVHTMDGGTTWDTQYFVTQRGINHIDMVSPAVGWAVGNVQTLLQTVDGGVTWSDRNPGIEDYSILDVDFVTFQKGYVLTASDLYYTPDGGTVWFQAKLPAMTNDGMDFFGTSNGCIVGDFGDIAYTTDGGIDFAAAPVAFGQRPLRLQGIVIHDARGIELTAEQERPVP